MLPFISGIRKLFIFFALYTSLSHCNIVYVYLSNKLPDYVSISLEQARLFNPTADIYLIANKSALEACKDNLVKHKIITVPVENLEPSSYHQLFIRKSTLNTTSLNGLWFKSTERFFYMHELMEKYNLTSVIHIEADNMIYMDVSELKHAFDRYQGIGAVFDSNERCIPSVVYISNEKAIRHLITFIADNAHKGLTDMYILGLYRNTFLQEHVDNLPLIMPEYAAQHPLMNARNQKAKNPSAYMNHINLFNSIFDAAAIGQYLGGVDLIHGPSKPGFINETCFFNPSYLNFEWHNDAQGRKVPYARYNNTRYRINNLHIHSKHLEAFRS